MSTARILVVEDEGIVAQSIQNMLNNLGYDVCGIALTGKAAVRKAGETQPDLVLMDIKLKGDMDGVDAAEQILELFDLPVVFLTAYVDEATLRRAKITQPFGYLLKPFEEQDLHSTIEIALYKSKMDRKLKEREHWFSTVLQSIGDGVIVTDKGGKVTFMNPVAEELSGKKLEKVSGKSMKGNFNITNEETVLSKLYNGRKPIDKSNLHRINQSVLSKENRKIPIDCNNAPILDDKGSMLGNVLVFRDITERVDAQEELRQSFIKTQRVLEETIHAISRIVETRDPYTAGHQQRVANLACAIATEMGLPDDQIDGIRFAGAIHDIGKLFVPAEILSKPTKLNDAEMVLVKSHPKVGYEILKGIEFPWPVAEIILQHHERMLGDGYPNGLKGPEILLGARILAVADVVEAMSSHRPYRPALGINKALEEISVYRSYSYDPDVVDACLRIFEKKYDWISKEMGKPIFAE